MLALALLITIPRPGAAQITVLPAPSYVPPLPSGVVAVDAFDNGATVRLGVGDDLLIRLPANLFTGYRWVGVQNNPGILASVDPFDVAGIPSVSMPRVFVVGRSTPYQRFRLRAVQPGATTVALAYYGPVPSAPLAIYQLNVLVAPPGVVLPDLE